MKQALVRYGVIPFLFGFLMLGAMGHPSGHASRAPADQSPRIAAPAPPPTHLRRALGNTEAEAASVPLPAYVPEPDDSGCSGIRVCHWAT